MIFCCGASFEELRRTWWGKIKFSVTACHSWLSILQRFIMVTPTEKRSTPRPIQQHVLGQRLPVLLIMAPLFAVVILWFIMFDKLLTKDYTVCSTSNNIYTVDEVNPRVECILVRGSIIHDTGSFGIRDIILAFCLSSLVQKTSRGAGYNPHYQIFLPRL